MNGVNDNQYSELSGQFEARYLAFLETISTLRPSLHRYCARMTGSVMDGEDVVQEALFEAYRKLDKFDDSRPIKPWLFRIAHNRCIDFLRRRGVRDEADAAAAVPEAVEPSELVFGTGKAVEHLVLTLPPKERACILLKDVLDYSLEEIAELVDSTVGGRQGSAQPRAHKAGGVFSIGEAGSKCQPRVETSHATLRRTLQRAGLGGRR